MKITLIFSVLFVCSAICFSQEPGKTASTTQHHQVISASVRTDIHSAEAHALDGNYGIQLKIEQAGAESMEINVISAKSNFEFVLNDPLVSFKGTIFPHKDGKYLLEYSLTISQPDPSKKPANKTQNNNQMLNSGLVSFILKSTLSYAPSQQINEEESRPQILLRASSLLNLDQSVSLLSTKKVTVRLAMSKCHEP